MERFRREDLGAGVTAVTSREHGFGTDAFLLAAFAAPRAGERACDLGTGCGIIPLLWCRAPVKPAKILGIDVQPLACEQAGRGALLSGLTDIFTVLNSDFRTAAGEAGRAKWDLVCANPPYRALGAGLQSRRPSARAARHETMCTIGEVCAAAASLLRFSGRFCLCHKPERLFEVLCAMRKAGIEPKKIRMVAYSACKAPYLVLIEGRKGGKPGLTVLPELLLTDATGAYTPEMQAIYAGRPAE